MRVVLQVVNHASVEIDHQIHSSIQEGFLLLVSYTEGDTLDTIHKVIDKIVSLRIFMDENGKTNLPFDKEKQEILCVSQFTLYADISHGRRPSFINCMRPELATKLYQDTLDYLKEIGVKTKAGVFGADMKIDLENEGPFTLMIDSKEL